jgi:hypothetical protein
LGFTFMDTDDYFWLPTEPLYTQKRDRTERIILMRQDIARADHAVVAGSLVDWGDELIGLFTLAIRLETATAIRIGRLRQRERAKFGSRIDPSGEPVPGARGVHPWAAAYDQGGLEMRSKAKHDAWQHLLGCEQLALNGAGDLQANIGRVIEAVRRLDPARSACDSEDLSHGEDAAQTFHLRHPAHRLPAGCAAHLPGRVPGL